VRWLGLCLALAACGDQAMPLLPSPDAADAPDAALQPSPDALVDAAVTPLIVIEETTFVMGCRADRARCGPDERPGQPVTLSRFAIDRAEVTQARYQAYLDATGAAAPKVGFEPAVTPEHPVVYVSWDEARAFCRWAGGDLPTAAQWELTLRGPPDGPLHDAAYPWGDEPPDCARANTEGCAGGTVAGGTLPLGRSAYGADNLVDNVREWVRDSYDAASHQMWESPEKRDPAGGARGPYRELRGASFAIWPIEGRAHETLRQQIPANALVTVDNEHVVRGELPEAMGRGRVIGISALPPFLKSYIDRLNFSFTGYLRHEKDSSTELHQWIRRNYLILRDLELKTALQR